MTEDHAVVSQPTWISARPERVWSSWQRRARAIVSAAAAEPAVTPAQISCARHANVMHVFVNLNSGRSQLSKQQPFCVVILWQAE